MIASVFVKDEKGLVHRYDERTLTTLCGRNCGHMPLQLGGEPTCERCSDDGTGESA